MKREISYIASVQRSGTHLICRIQIEPLVLFYEDVVASHRAPAERVVEFLGLPFLPGLEIPQRAIEKQSNQSLTNAWYLALGSKKRKQAGLHASFGGCEFKRSPIGSRDTLVAAAKVIYSPSP